MATILEFFIKYIKKIDNKKIENFCERDTKLFTCNKGSKLAIF